MLATSVLLAAALAAGADARASSAPPTVAVLEVAPPPAAPPPELAALTRKLEEAVGGRAGTVLPAEQIRRRVSGREGTATLSELDRAYLGAVAAQRAGDLPGAARTLHAVVDDLERLPETDGGAGSWQQAILRLAAVNLALGYRPDARDLVGRLLRVEPNVRPDPELYPPSFLRLVDEVRAEVRALPVRKLTVSTGGLPARVFVEGREVGAAPATVPLRPGTYRVSAATASALVRAPPVELAAEDRAVALDVGLAAAFFADGPGFAVPDAARAATAITAGATLRVDRVLAVSSAMDRDVRYLVVGLYDVATGQLAREGRVRLAGWTPAEGAIPAVADFVVDGAPSGLVIVTAGRRPDLAARPAPEQAGAPLLPTSPAPGGAARGSSALGWAAIGAAGLAVAAGAFAVYEGSAASSKYSDAKKMVGPDGRLLQGSDAAGYNAAVRAGDRATNLGRASAGAAIGLAATSVVLGIVSYRTTGAIGPLRF
jgi:hypothetical protein